MLQPIKRSQIMRAKPNAEPKVRMRKCAVQSCRTPFQPRNMMHKCCSPDCALAFAVAERERKDRLDRLEGLVKLKTRQKWLKEAQAAFNAWVRERDAALPCVSCGRFHAGSYDAGHYRSVGAMPALRFHPLNVHKQCVPCNQHKGGNVIEYRLGLIARIGVAAVEFLEQDHSPAKYTINEIVAIKNEYRAKLAQLKKERT